MNAMTSSAELIRQQCRANGVPIYEIMGSNLINIYKKLPKMPGKAEFKEETALSYKRDITEVWDGEFVAVIIEDRPIEALFNAVSSIIEIAKIPVQIFYGTDNKEFVHARRFNNWYEQGVLSRTKVTGAKICASIYNQILMDRRFWGQVLGANKVLIFQADSICCKHSDYKLEDFASFDYIGANWLSSRPIGLEIIGGCGGFSLRDVARTIETIDRFPPKLWPGGEDGYYAFHIELMGGKVASLEEMSKFATQTWYAENSFGAHQVRLLPPEDHAKFLNYCPEIETVLGWK